MGLTYDHAGLAAVTLLRIAAEESEGPGSLTGRMRSLLSDLHQRNGADAGTEIAMTLARKYFVLLDSVAEALNLPPSSLLDAAELDELNRMQDG